MSNKLKLPDPREAYRSTFLDVNLRPYRHELPNYSTNKGRFRDALYHLVNAPDTGGATAYDHIRWVRRLVKLVNPNFVLLHDRERLRLLNMKAAQKFRTRGACWKNLLATGPGHDWKLLDRHTRAGLLPAGSSRYEGRPKAYTVWTGRNSPPTWRTCLVNPLTEMRYAVRRRERDGDQAIVDDPNYPNIHSDEE